MKITLICRSFDKNSGQGVYKAAGYLYENLIRYSNFEIEKIEAKNKNPYWFDLFECSKKVLSTDSDIYHFLMPEVCFPLLISKKLRGKSLVTIHDAIIYKIKERKWLSEKYIKFMYQLAKRAKIIHSPSYQSRKDLIKVLCIPKEKIFVIPWGIDLKRFRPLRRRRDEFTVGYLGGLGRRKNVDTVLRVAKTLERENIKFKIGGTGPQLNKLIKIKEKLKLKNVEFLGFIEEEKLPEFYNSLDVFLFPSSYEGFGIPVLEAMACGVHVISSKIPSSVEIGSNIFLYFKSEVEIPKLILNLRRKRSKKKLIKRAKKFDWKDVVEKFTQIYDTLSASTI